MANFPRRHGEDSRMTKRSWVGPREVQGVKPRGYFDACRSVFPRTGVRWRRKWIGFENETGPGRHGLVTRSWYRGQPRDRNGCSRAVDADIRMPLDLDEYSNRRTERPCLWFSAKPYAAATSTGTCDSPNDPKSNRPADLAFFNAFVHLDPQYQ